MGEGKIRKGTNGKFKYKEMGNKKERNATQNLKKGERSVKRYTEG